MSAIDELSAQQACQAASRASRTGERLSGGFRWRGVGDRVRVRRRWKRSCNFPTLKQPSFAVSCTENGRILLVILHNSLHIPSLLVVNRWAAAGESGSHRDFRFRHDVWTMVFHQLGERITSIISRSWHFTTKSGGVCKN